MYNIEGFWWIHCHIRDLKAETILEFGNQHIWVHAKEGMETKYDIARDYYLQDRKFKEYVSIDMNGQDGALRIDLSQPITNPDLLNHFDVVTNVGTLEHIPSDAQSQWNGFRNAVICAKKGGLILHELVPAGQWTDHCSVWYKDGIGKVLADALGCELIEEVRFPLTSLNSHVDYLCVALKRNEIKDVQETPSFGFIKRLLI